MQKLNPDLSKFVQIPSLLQAQVPSALPSGRNPFLRCPMPQSLTTDSDFLRQYHELGIPQYRIIPPLKNGVRPGNT